jgi:hypothetical protein
MEISIDEIFEHLAAATAEVPRILQVLLGGGHPSRPR